MLQFSKTYEGTEALLDTTLSLKLRKNLSNLIRAGGAVAAESMKRSLSITSANFLTEKGYKIWECFLFSSDGCFIGCVLP